MAYDALEESRYSGAPVKLFLVQGAPNTEAGGRVGPYAYNNSEQIIVRDGITYQPWPIKNSQMTHDGSLDKSDITITLALGTSLDELFLAYPPMQVVNLTIFEGHMVDDPTKENFRAVWMGRISGAGYEENELNLSCVPVSTAIQRPGLRRPYTIGCPHPLYGPQCRANKAAATTMCQVLDINRNRIQISSQALANPDAHVGGLVEWMNPDNGLKEIRTITAATPIWLTIRGSTRALSVGQEIAAIRGCNRQMSGCNSHNNILNYGGQPWIPLENPLSQKNQFY